MKLWDGVRILLALSVCALTLWLAVHRRCDPCTCWTGPDAREPGFVWHGLDSGPMGGCTPCLFAQSEEAKATCKKQEKP